MLYEIEVRDSAPVAVIDIGGVIGVPEQMQFGSGDERVATYGRFAAALDAIRRLKAEEVVVNIRSTGGDVNDALMIFDTLRGLEARVVTRCCGYVASAATIIAQAASPGCRQVSSGSLYLIHCCESAAEGNARSLSAAKELLDRTDGRLAAIYAERSGRPAEEFAALMNENGGKGRWLTPEETVAAGLADVVVAAGVTDGVERIGRGEVERMCRMLGVTMPPVAGGTPDGKRFAWMRSVWSALKRLLDGAAVPVRETLHEAGAAEENEGVGVRNAASQAAGAAGLPASFTEGQNGAYPTEVRPAEDPSADDYRPAPNEEAYRQDAMNIRRHGD